jgi:hypothetical protein
MLRNHVQTASPSRLNRRRWSFPNMLARMPQFL